MTSLTHLYYLLPRQFFIDLFKKNVLTSNIYFMGNCFFYIWKIYHYILFFLYTTIVSAAHTTTPSILVHNQVLFLVWKDNPTTTSTILETMSSVQSLILKERQ